MKTIKNNILIILLSAIALSSCTERIELDLDETYTRLVVDGKITNLAGPHQIRLLKTGAYLSSDPSPVVSDALVRISDGYQTYAFTESDDSPGLYLSSAELTGVPGRTYSLNIELPEAINDSRFYTAECHMPGIGSIDSVQTEYNERWNGWQVKIYAIEPPEENYYLFNVYKNSILLTDTISEVFYSDDLFFNGQPTNGIGVGWLDGDQDDEIPYEGDTIMLEMAGITREYEEFIMAVQLETGYSNPLFSGPPANIQGNISNGGIGFFAAYAVARASVIYHQP